MKPHPSLLSQHLDYLKLPFLQKYHVELAQQAAQQNWDPLEYLRRLIEGEYSERRQRVIERRVKAARFPVLKTLEQFRWDWPKKINRLQVQNLFRLEFIAQKANAVLLGSVVRNFSRPALAEASILEVTVTIVVTPSHAGSLVSFIGGPLQCKWSCTRLRGRQLRCS